MGLALLKMDTNSDLLATEQVTEQVGREERILEFCAEPKTREEIQTFMGISHREHFRAKILKPLLKSGKLKMTIPDKPNSRNQKYIRAECSCGDKEYAVETTKYLTIF